MPILMAAVFLWSESLLRHWLGDKLDRDIELLNMIATGELHRTRSGAYLQSLQDVFPPAIRGDMLCMLQLTIELSVRAKGDMLMREAGLTAKISSIHVNGWFGDYDKLTTSRLMMRELFGVDLEASGEESVAQVQLRAQRLGLAL
jgi:hypothetical protein